MLKKILLVAGALVATGSVAAVSSPQMRDVRQRFSQLLFEAGYGDHASRGASSGRRGREMNADEDDSGVGRQRLGRSRWVRSARADFGEDAEDMPRDRPMRFGREPAEHGRHRGSADVDFGGGRGSGDPRSTHSERVGSGRGADRAQLRFSRIDRNGDGFIDSQELQAWATERATRAAQRFLERYDTDGDGRVSRGEFDRLIRQPTADADRDDARMIEAELLPETRGGGVLE